MKLTACSIVGILIAAAFVGLLANPMQNVGAAPYQDGSIESPWLIYNVQELQDKMNLDLGAHYALAVDIDGSATSTWNGGEGFDPVGNDTGSYWDGSKWVYPNSFTGSLDGRNLTITGLYINRPTKDYVGLFGTTNGDVVKNVGLMNCDITGQNYVGGIAGNKEGGVVENSYATGTVTGRGSLGGLMGQNSGVVENSYADVSVTGTHALIGGLVGGNWGGTVNNCHATGAVLGATTNGYGQVGGLVGDSSGTVTNSYATGDTTATNTWGHSVGGLIGKNSGLVEDSYATGATSATYSYAGGLVGYNEGIISGCHAAGSATSESRVGGLVGWNRYDGNVEQSYATGAAAGASHVGGLVGANGGETWDAGTPTITNCYSTGTVTRNSGSETTFGGFVGSNIRGKITNCYSTGVVMGFTDRGFVGGLDTAVPYEMRGNFWDNETSGQSSSAGSVDGGSELPQGRNTAEMKTLSTFMDASWNFVDVWYMTGGYTYPLLLRHYVPFQVNLRDTPGFQLVSIPCNQELLASRNWTAYDLAADIEANTDIQVLYISDYDGKWNTFIHRDSGGNLMPNLWGFNNFTISSEKGYMIAINTDGATDFVWELPIWMVEPSAPSVLNLKKGWNAVGFIYTTGAPTPGNIVSGNANIDRTAAWINDQWQNELTVFNNIFEQNCDGLMQTFDASRNAHGFFVRATQAHTWNQGA